MRMMLTSGGVSDGPVLDALTGLLGGPPAEARCALVIDAILPFPGDKSKLVRDLAGIRAMGWDRLDVLSLFAGPPPLVESRLRDADVVFCYGGSNHWLAHAWTATGLTGVLRELLDEKVYLGLSAGSMIFSRRHREMVEAFDDQEEVRMLRLAEVGPALPLFDWSVMAHLGAEYFPFATDAWAAEGAARLGAPVWFLDDASALVVRDPALEPEVVSDGHWLRFGDGGRLIDAR